jgi:diaminohydroxyphosphoribosylaminopyrimidine deaminase/5-amino-6-(5-phosphoribosylamino)uracil reductase
VKWIPINVPHPEFLEKAMREAVFEARKWLGATSPNPPVGAVALDEAGQVIATAAHQKAGELHAETLLIEACRDQKILEDLHTMCVTLEPCNHQGRTPPCTDAIIAAGIKRVVIGTRDPNPRVTGGGIEKLRAAGVEVITGVAEEECRQLMHAFLYNVKTGKPWVTVKRALTRDGSMIPPAGQKTFTSPSSLLLAHRLRKKSDAILTGSGTVLADHPLFTVRHVQDYPNKRRWLGILDRRGRTPSNYIEEAKTRGLDVVIYQNIAEAFDNLAEKGAQDVLVEAGPTLSESLLDSRLWTMSVTVRQAETDTIDVAFNPKTPLPFDAQQFHWDNVLPQD